MNIMHPGRMQKSNIAGRRIMKVFQDVEQMKAINVIGEYVSIISVGLTQREILQTSKMAL